jgi:hypothetical protein
MSLEDILYYCLLYNEIETAENYIKSAHISGLDIYKIMSCAANKNYVDVVNFIIDYNLKFHFYSKVRISESVIIAASYNYINLMKILLKNPNIDPAYDYNAAIKIASNLGSLEIVRELLNDSRVNPYTNNNYAIKQAIYKGHTEIVKELLQDPRVTSDPIIYNAKCCVLILEISLEQQLMLLIEIPLELCEIVQSFVFRKVY